MLDSSLLEKTLESFSFPEALGHFKGKVRENFLLKPDLRAIVVTDRISAFDYVLGTIPLKGQVLNELAAWWFRKLDEIEIPHHLKEVPHPNVSMVENVTPLPVEIIVRGYLTGTTTTSAWYAYQHHNREICGIKMPEGMKKNEPFPKPIITPTTKPETGHDKNISREEIIAEGLVPKEIYEQAESFALKMFSFGQQLAAERGLILVDTKYEMGITKDGRLIVIDEVHTPDSSRYWIAETYEARLAEGKEPQSLDKEFVRRMLVEAGYNVDDPAQNPKDFLTDEIRLKAAEKYLSLFEKITGEPLKYRLPDKDLEAEIREVLKAYL